MHALVIEVGWPEDAACEPIPAAAVSLLGSLAERSLDPYVRVPIPPVVVGGRLRLGAIVAASRVEAGALLARVRAALDGESSLADSALVVEPEVAELTSSPGWLDVSQLAMHAERLFLDPNPRSTGCATSR